MTDSNNIVDAVFEKEEKCNKYKQSIEDIVEKLYDAEWSEKENNLSRKKRTEYKNLIKKLQNSEGWWKDLECSKFIEEKHEQYDGAPLYNEITAEIAAEAKKAHHEEAERRAAKEKTNRLDKSTYKKVEEFVTSHALFLKTKLNEIQVEEYLSKNFGDFNTKSKSQQALIVGVTIAMISGSITLYKNRNRVKQFFSRKKQKQNVVVAAPAPPSSAPSTKRSKSKNKSKSKSKKASHHRKV